MMSRLIPILVAIGLGLSCQMAPKTQSGEASPTEPVLKLVTKLQVMEGPMKRTTAKGLWHIKGRNYLRLDITGPFDLLLAQVFVTPERTVVINHSQKQVKEVLSTELIDIHNVTVRPLDLVALMQKEVPRKALNHSGWSCSQNQSSWTCVQKDAKAAWINPDQFFLEIPGKSLTVTVLNRVTLDTNSHFFEPKYPSHYLKQP